MSGFENDEDHDVWCWEAMLLELVVEVLAIDERGDSIGLDCAQQHCGPDSHWHMAPCLLSGWIRAFVRQYCVSKH